VDTGVDYRLRTLERMEMYLTPLGAENDAKLARDFVELARGEGTTKAIEVLGREIPVVRYAARVIWFEFAALCGGPRSQNDYLEIALRFDTVLLSGVPRLGGEKASEARRFTWLIDILYDQRVKLVLSAACPADEIYLVGPNAQEFPRTVSRLMEMRSREYLEAVHRTV
jgi:cell division protein ZapE